MKKLGMIIAGAALACITAISAAATATITYDLVELTETTGKIVCTVTNPGGHYYAFKNDITFDANIFKPVNKKSGADVALTVGSKVSSKAPIQVSQYYDEDEEEYVDVTQPANPAFTLGEDGKCTLVVEHGYTGYIEADDLVLMEFSFKYADGKSKDDIKADSFVLDYAKYCDRVTGDELSTGTLKVVNNVVPTPVNAEIAMTGEVGIRSDAAETTGIRFVGTTATANKDTVKEYGFIAAIESEKSGLKGTDYTVDLDLVAAGKAAKGIAFNKEAGTDIVYDVDGEDTIITCIVNGMPINAKSVKTDIAVRAYMVLADGTTVYSATTTKDCAYDVAYAIKAADGTEYAENKDYVDEILAQDATQEVPIDLSPLFE